VSASACARSAAGYIHGYNLEAEDTASTVAGTAAVVDRVEGAGTTAAEAAARTAEWDAEATAAETADTAPVYCRPLSRTAEAPTS